MSFTAAQHRQIAAYHLAEAAKLEGVLVAPTPTVGSWTEWGPGVLPSQVGNQAPMPRCYDTHRMIWEAAQRGDPTATGGANILTNGVPGWPDKDGQPFRIQRFQRLGTQAVYDAIVWLVNDSPEYAEWAGSPAVAPYLPKIPPAMEPLSK